MKTLLFYLLLITACIHGQNSIPFGSNNNSIAISVNNTSVIDAGNVTVELRNPPSWLKFQSLRTVIKDLRSHTSSSAQFVFSAENGAPVGKAATLEFIIRSAAGEEWTKEISVQVSAPEQFELYQNFPNPFNPSTTIAFQIPQKSHITIMLYDITGREVRSVYSGIKEPGYYEEHLDLHDLSSGVYMYRLSGDTFNEIKKLILLK